MKKDSLDILDPVVMPYDPLHVLKKAGEEIKKRKGEGDAQIKPQSYLYKSLSLKEFENGMLMSTAIPEQYWTFALNLSRDLQKEFLCNTASEKALVESTAINYVRTLEIERRITRYLALGEITDMGVRYLGVLSKELDRAQRHYLSSMQVLKSLRQPVFQLKVKADTAVLGQNQAIQVKNA